MEYTFFYVSAILIPILFFVCVFFKKTTLATILIGLVSIGYSLLSDLTFGDIFKLFYYITPKKSTLYMILGALLIYSFLNMLYTLFLPKKTISIISYTAVWIIALLIFEFFSVQTKTVVFTGWRPFPWSIVLYIVSYLWIFSLYRYLLTRIKIKQ